MELDSNFLRELQFVSHHSTHHMAMIRVICTNLGVSLPSDFGIAASTRNDPNSAYNLRLLSSKIKK